MSISATNIKYGYVKLYGPENIRYGSCREINLVNFLPEYLTDRDTIYLLSAFEGYLNEMYAGTGGYTIATSALEVTACNTSACLLSAVDNQYDHDTYASSSSTSVNTLNTAGNDASRIFVDNFCQAPATNISILEKIVRLTELFDPDLIPIELIQFYAENLGYNVGLSRNNIGINFKDTSEEINQKKYLRFVIRNLPTWYKVKTTRNSIKMMLYTFGLIGDLIYYFTKDYIDPAVSLSATNSIFSKYIITDGMSFKQIQEIKCSLSQFEEFKNNKKKYFEMLKSLQLGLNNNWKLTDLDRSTTNEDISNIPDNFFSTPHFRLWFNILESIGNYSTDLEKQRLMGQAILAIKPINTVFEGITGYFQVLVNMYLLPYPKFRKHIILMSDGYADYWS